MSVEYRVLGPLEVSVYGRPARLGAPKQRATLALLLCQPNTVVPPLRPVYRSSPSPQERRWRERRAASHEV